MEKVYLTPTFHTWSTSPPNYETVCFTPELSKTVYFTPWTVSAEGCYSNSGVATVPVVLNFLFLFIFGEFFKNHSKSYNEKSNFIGLHMSRFTQ